MVLGIATDFPYGVYLMELTMRYRSILFGCLTLFVTSAKSSEWQVLGQGVLVQNSSGLKWSKQDNGLDINWANAKAYCAKLGEGWRLPSVEELRSLHVQALEARETTQCGEATCTVSPLFELTSAWHWSSEPLTKEQSYDFKELAWGMTLVNGRQTMALRFGSSASRALCVKK